MFLTFFKLNHSSLKALFSCTSLQQSLITAGAPNITFSEKELCSCLKATFPKIMRLYINKNVIPKRSISCA